jgi:hypothetical protein
VDLTETSDDWLAERRDMLRKRKSRVRRIDEAIAADLDAVDQEFYRRFSERNSKGTRTNKFMMSLVIDDHYPEITDKTEFDNYLLKTKKLHLMQKRLSMTSVREEQDLLRKDKQDWLERLEEDGWSKELCTKCLEHITYCQIDETCDTEEEAAVLEEQLASKLAVLEAIGNWRDATKLALEDYYRIPGVNLVQKMKLSQKKV